MNKKQLGNQIKRYLKGNILNDIEMRTMELKYPAFSDANNTRVTTSFNVSAPFEKYIENKLEDDILRALYLEQRTMEFYFESLSEVDQEILTYYYKDGYNWDIVGVKVGYSVSQSRRKRNKALEKLEEELNRLSMLTTVG